MRGAAAISLVLCAGAAAASPNVSLDDPAYEELHRLLLVGELPAFEGGFVPLTERRVRSLLGAPPLPSGLWFAPVNWLRITGTLFEDAARPYSTAIRPRDLTVGSISIACERQEGRPCGDGAGTFGELESSAGYGRWISATIRARVQAGQSYTNGFALDRAYLNAEIGPFAAELGRDIVVLGPSARTQLGWGTNAAPITHARISTSKPFRLARSVHASAFYMVGRLRAPQRYPHGLVTIGRGQFDLGDDLELGLMQLLQLGGEGAPSLGVWDFITEHFRRKDLTASEADSSNRRFGGDIALRIRELRARLYYSLIFEDIRRARFIDAVRYDADHLFGVEVALDASGKRALLVEWHQTGFRSQEHTPRKTGFTHTGRVVGSALGPDATSLYAKVNFRLGRVTLYPWLEFAKLSSDTYEQITNGPINRLTRGQTESRYRGGTLLRIELSGNIAFDTELELEHVTGFAFEPASVRTNLGAAVSIIWYPQALVRAP